MNEFKRTLQSSYATIVDRFYEANHHKFLETHFEQFFKVVKPNGIILDVGCGTGRDTAVFKKHNFQTVGLDLTYEMLQKGKLNGVDTPLVQADIEALPIKHGVDGIWASASLLHIPKQKIPTVLDGFYSLLNYEGILYATVKQGLGDEWKEISYKKKAKRFFNYWQTNHWNDALENAGFKILEEWTDTTRTDNWLVRICKKESV